MPAVDPISLVVVALGICFLVAAYRRDVAWHRARSTEVRWMLGATLVGLVALVSPLDAAADRSTAWHMVQHVLIVSAVGPLLVLSRPLEIMPWVLPGRSRVRLVGVSRSIHRHARHHTMWCFVAAAAYIATLWAFHIPAVYDTAVSSNLWHGLEHVMLVTVSFVLWWTLIGTRRRAGYGIAFLAMFLVALASTALGAMLVLARRPLYHLPAASADPTQLLVDQQVAGVVMWAYGGVLTAAGALAMFVVWMRDADRRTELHESVAGGRHVVATTDASRSASVVVRSILPAGPVLAAALLVFAGLSHTTASPAGDQVRADPEANGAPAVFRRDCAQCHGSSGEGTTNAPPLIDASAAYVDYVVSSGRMPLQQPDDAVKRGPAKYDRDTTIALAEYVGAFGEPDPDAPDIPTGNLDGSDIAHGGELYRLNCAACHQSVGAGGALVDRAAPPLGSATPTQVMEAIRVGPFEMPAFGDAAMSDDEVRDVAAYVTEVIQQPDDRGGWSIWHLGPVPEGAVAIIGGLGLLVLVSRWIERRSTRAR